VSITEQTAVDTNQPTRLGWLQVDLRLGLTMRVLQSYHHQVGACRMGTDRTAVVDP
jgi:choline dehydrogenase-like flavoprotein